jgi:hypothetical protein
MRLSIIAPVALVCAALIAGHARAQDTTPAPECATIDVVKAEGAGLNFTQFTQDQVVAIINEAALDKVGSVWIARGGADPSTAVVAIFGKDGCELQLSPVEEAELSHVMGDQYPVPSDADKAAQTNHTTGSDS